MLPFEAKMTEKPKKQRISDAEPVPHLSCSELEKFRQEKVNSLKF
ncbi:MAG: hypothetical protein ACM3VV_05975 [Deltaproteobacteria bacterium]|nr:hypothetical protein [Nitrososphaeraceae archaeon]